MATAEVPARDKSRNFICIGCAAPIKGVRRTKRYCAACAAAARKASSRKYDAAHHRDRSIKKQKVCGGCGSEFTTTKAWVRYCEPCRDKAHSSGPSSHYYLKNPDATVILGVERCCRECGGVFPVKARRQQFCSRSCYRKSCGASPENKINARMRAGMHKSLKSGKGGRSWSGLVGYSVADLKQHLERQFQHGMGWHNMGEWHIDHRQPLASFSFVCTETPEFMAAWSITNLQPLWAEHNIKKKAKRIFLV